jgi:hypothetical protein
MCIPVNNHTWGAPPTFNFELVVPLLMPCASHRENESSILLFAESESWCKWLTKSWHYSFSMHSEIFGGKDLAIARLLHRIALILAPHRILLFCKNHKLDYGCYAYYILSYSACYVCRRTLRDMMHSTELRCSPEPSTESWVVASSSELWPDTATHARHHRSSTHKKLMLLLRISCLRQSNTYMYLIRRITC